MHYSFCSFEEAINYATEGDSTQIDMLVGDIYGKFFYLCMSQQDIAIRIVGINASGSLFSSILLAYREQLFD